MSNGIYLILGTNLGARLQNLAAAKLEINRLVGTIKNESSLYETAPWGVHDQPNYLNQVIEIKTKMPPHQLLTELLSIEKNLGRTRELKWEARIVDIDVLFYNDEVMNTNQLQIPHPRLHERNFTLIPLVEIARNFIHPVFKKSILTLLDESPDTLSVSHFKEVKKN